MKTYVRRRSGHATRDPFLGILKLTILMVLFIASVIVWIGGCLYVGFGFLAEVYNWPHVCGAVLLGLIPILLWSHLRKVKRRVFGA